MVKNRPQSRKFQSAKIRRKSPVILRARDLLDDSHYWSVIYAEKKKSYSLTQQNNRLLLRNMQSLLYRKILTSLLQSMNLCKLSNMDEQKECKKPEIKSSPCFSRSVLVNWFAFLSWLAEFRRNTRCLQPGNSSSSLHHTQRTYVYSIYFFSEKLL